MEWLHLTSVIFYRSINRTEIFVLPLVVPPHQTQAYGARSFSVAAPTLWNSLPVDIKNAQSLFIFKKKLKTFLFNQRHS